MTLKNDREPFLCYVELCHHFKAISVFLLELQSRNAQFWSKSGILFVPCDLEIRWMNLKTNRVLLLCCFKLCVSFESHQWIQTEVTIRKHPIWVNIDDFLSRMALKFDRWPWKAIGHLIYATSNVMHHFILGRNRQILAVWPWNLMDGLEKQ